MSERKIQIPTKEGRRITTLEAENAELWFEKVITDAKVSTQEQEIADLWFTVATGGV